MTSLFTLAAQLESGASDAPATVPTVAPHQDPADVPESVLTTPDKLQALLIDGGYATVTVHNATKKTHVTLTVVARKRKPDGKGYISRATKLGRVGLGQADLLEVRDPDREYPENYVGRWYKDGGWKAGGEADAIRAAVAAKVLAWALAGGDMWGEAEVRVSTRCQVCGKKLTHPESIDDLIGPECKGQKTTSSTAAPHVSAAAA